MRHVWEPHVHFLSVEVCKHCGLRRRRTSARRDGKCRSVFLYSRNPLDAWGVRYLPCSRPETRGHREWERGKELRAQRERVGAE